MMKEDNQDGEKIVAVNVPDRATQLLVLGLV